MAGVPARTAAAKMSSMSDSVVEAEDSRRSRVILRWSRRDGSVKPSCVQLAKNSSRHLIVSEHHTVVIAGETRLKKAHAAGELLVILPEVNQMRT